MNTRGHKFGGDWTEQKLDCVSKYLRSYTQIMKDRNFHFSYIDAFAGTGHRKLKCENNMEIQRFLAGSARRALEVKPPFKEYICFAAGNPNAPKALQIAEDILEKMRTPQLAFPV